MSIPSLSNSTGYKVASELLKTECTLGNSGFSKITPSPLLIRVLEIKYKDCKEPDTIMI